MKTQKNLNNTLIANDLLNFSHKWTLAFKGCEFESENRRRVPRKNKCYFTSETEQAICDYNNAKTEYERNKIYLEKIKFPFEKIVENIYNTFKFTYCDMAQMDMQKDVISHLIQNISKFNPSKGKAFSYFSVAAKNYLIARNNLNFKLISKNIPISETKTEDAVCMQADDKYYELTENKELINLLISYWEKETNNIFRKQTDRNIVYSILELMRQYNFVENYEKKFLYIYIRNMSNSNTAQITRVLNKMKSYYKIIIKQYYRTGTFYSLL